MAARALREILACINQYLLPAEYLARRLGLFFHDRRSYCISPPWHALERRRRKSIWFAQIMAEIQDAMTEVAAVTHELTSIQLVLANIAEELGQIPTELVDVPRQRPYELEFLSQLSHLVPSDVATRPLPAHESDEGCPICMSVFEPYDHIFTLSCGHQFHTGCLARHLHINWEQFCCPLCRRPIIRQRP